MKDSRVWPFQAGDDPNVVAEDLYLAVVRRYKPMSRHGLLRWRNGAKYSLDVIETAGIDDQVGIIHWRNHQYLTTRANGCYFG